MNSQLILHRLGAPGTHPLLIPNTQVAGHTALPVLYVDVRDVKTQFLDFVIGKRKGRLGCGSILWRGRLEDWAQRLTECGILRMSWWKLMKHTGREQQRKGQTHAWCLSSFLYPYIVQGHKPGNGPVPFQAVFPHQWRQTQSLTPANLTWPISHRYILLRIVH